MNLDDIKAQWQEHDTKLERLLKLNASAVRELKLTATRSSLRRLGSGIVLELVISVAALLLLGGFMASHVRQPEYLIPALALHLGTIAYAGACIRQLTIVGSLELDGPVVTVQKALERVRIVRIQMTKWTFALALVLWLPLLIVSMKGLVGVDLYRIFGEIGARHSDLFNWLIANALFGVAGFVAILWISRRFEGRFDRSPFVKSLLDDIAGRSLTSAMRSLDSIVEFERGEEPRS